MIIEALLLIAGSIILGGVIGFFWEDIRKWLVLGLRKVEELTRLAVEGSKIIMRKLRDAVSEIAFHYNKDKLGRWHETTVTREISAHEVPKDILAKIKKSETDMTGELRMLLSE